jgi:actin-related protein
MSYYIHPNLFKYPDFCGASVIGPKFSKEDEYWISRTDWDEVGPDILFKKCDSIVLNKY